MVDVIAVATGAVQILTPFLPYLMSLGNSVEKKLETVIEEQGGEVIWKQAQNLWSKITGRFGDDEDITDVAKTAARRPEDETRQQTLAQVLAEHLKEDADLAQEIQTLMGGEKRLQQVIAENDAFISRIRQKMTGPGEQTVRGGKILTDIDQEMTG